jgi:RNA polymerase sigma-70 factor, ECF subfamily
MSAVQPLQAPAIAERTVDAADGVRCLYEEHARAVFRFCLGRLPSREDAEDAAQTTFAQAYSALRRGTVPQLERPWLLAIARNVCASHWRSSAGNRAIEVVRDPTVLEKVAAAHEPATEELIPLREALVGLTELQRRAILLREWKGLSYHEIAAELGLSQSAVETLIFRARRALAAGLTGETSRVRRVAARALDIGPLLGWIKSLLGMSSPIKLALASVAVGGVVAVAPLAQDRNDRASIVSRGAPSSVVGGGSPRDAAGDRPFLSPRPVEPSRGRLAGLGPRATRPAGASPSGGAASPSIGSEAPAPGAPGSQSPATNDSRGGSASPSASTTPGSPVIDTVEEVAEGVVPANAVGVVPSIPAVPSVEVPELPPIPPVQVPGGPHVPSVELPVPPPLQAPKVGNRLP